MFKVNKENTMRLSKWQCYKVHYCQEKFDRKIIKLLWQKGRFLASCSSYRYAMDMLTFSRPTGSRSALNVEGLKLVLEKMCWVFVFLK